MHHAYIDKFAYQNSPIHQLDSRIKFLVTIAFTFFVISVPTDSISVLAFYAIWPFTILVIGKIPLRFALKHVLKVSPFILVLALSFPLYHRQTTYVAFGPFSGEISIGWIKCFNILGKFIITVLALIALISTTKFNDLIVGLQKMKFPKVLIMQLAFLYRYIFVLIDHAQHMLQARAGRRLKNLGLKKEIKITAAMIGSLLARSIDNAEKITIAMQGRGFDGSWRTISRQKIHFYDMFFALIALVFFIFLHFFIKFFMK